MKSEYTKGEWEVRKGELNTKEIFITCDKADIAKVFQQLPNAEANAHLIAQAPKLYEALKVLLLSIRNHKQCTVCNGTGKRKLLDMPHECEFCWGSGLELETVPARLAITEMEV